MSTNKIHIKQKWIGRDRVEYIEACQHQHHVIEYDRSNRCFYSAKFIRFLQRKQTMLTITTYNGATVRQLFFARMFVHSFDDEHEIIIIIIIHLIYLQFHWKKFINTPPLLHIYNIFRFTLFAMYCFHSSGLHISIFHLFFLYFLRFFYFYKSDVLQHNVIIV